MSRLNLLSTSASRAFTTYAAKVSDAPELYSCSNSTVPGSSPGEINGGKSSEAVEVLFRLERAGWTSTYGLCEALGGSSAR